MTQKNIPFYHKVFDYGEFRKNFSSDALKTFEEVARKEARRCNSDYVGSSHLFSALLKDGGIREILQTFNVDISTLEDEIDEINKKHQTPRGKNEEIPLTPRFKKIIERAYNLSRRYRELPVNNKYLFLAIVAEKETECFDLLKKYGIKKGELEKKLR